MKNPNLNQENQVAYNLPKTFFKFILRIITPYKLQFCSLIFLASISASYGTINSYLLKLLINIVEATTNKESLLEMILWPALFYIINLEIHHISWRILNYINLFIIPKIKTSIINHSLNYAYKHSYSFFQENFGGTIANNIISLADSTENIISNVSMPVIRGLIQVVFALTSMYFVNPLFSLTLFVWIISFIIISTLYSNKIKLLSNKYTESQAILSGKIIDSITNSINSRIFAREKFETYNIQKYLQSISDRFHIKEKFLLKFLFIQGLSITVLVAIMITLLINLKTNNLVTTGDFAFILGLVIYVTDNVWFLTDQINKINDTIGKCDYSLNNIFVDHEIKDSVNAKPLSVTKGEIVFNNVKFGYKDNKDFFDIKSLVIPAGQKIGLVGHSGGGKTTFVNLIIRLFEVSSGQILIDGQSIKEVTQSSLRSSISIIPQDPILFHRTLLENICYGKLDATDKEIIEAAKKAHAHDFIQGLPDGYNSVVGERGIKLSGGQRQRIAIARAILKNSPIFILDEATSQLDSTTESIIQKSFWQLVGNKTTIVIAHRLSTLLHMDYILVFEKGNIVEQGTHKSLLDKKGLYKNMWEAQVGGFLSDGSNN